MEPEISGRIHCFRKFTHGHQKTREDEPDRLLKGCYLGVDAVLDRVRVLKTRLAAMEKGHRA